MNVYSADHNRRLLQRLWFCISYCRLCQWLWSFCWWGRGLVNCCCFCWLQRGPFHGCGSSVDHIQASSGFKCSVYHTEISSMIVRGSVDHTEASSMNVIVLLIPLWSRQRLLYSADNNWRSLHRLWFRWSYRGFVKCVNYVDHWGLVHGCDSSVDNSEASSIAVLLITHRPLTWLWWFRWSHCGFLWLWLFYWSHWSVLYDYDGSVEHTEASYTVLSWWFCWSHESLVYSIVCDGSVDHVEASSTVWLLWFCWSHWSLVQGCDGSDNHTEASSMVVMALMITLTHRLWLWWFWWSHWSLVYGCDGSVDHTEASSMVVMVLLAPGSSFQAPDLYDKITKVIFSVRSGVWWCGGG